MYAAPAILQQRASSLGSVGEQMDNGDMGVAADICFSIGIDYFLHGHALFLGNIVNVAGIEDDCLLVDTALSAPAALEPEFRIQIQQMFLQVLNALTGLHHFE